MIKNFFQKNKLLFKSYAKNIALVFGFGFSVLAFSILISYLLYQPKKMVKRGFEVEIKIADNKLENVGGVKTGNLPNAKNDTNSQAKIINIAEMIAKADIDKGMKTFKKCSTCHNVEKNGANKVGPNLYSVVGRRVASISGFSYSSALMQKGGNWTVEDLDKWLANPKGFVPGTKMGFAGLKKPEDRANVIAYLKNQK